MHSDHCWSDDYCAINVEADRDGDRTRIMVTGELDAYTLPQLTNSSPSTRREQSNSI